MLLTKRNYVACYGFDEDENSIWLCASDKNVICKIDKNSKTGNVIGAFPDFNVNSGTMSWAVKCIERYVVFCPFGADHLMVYDKETNDLSSHRIIEPQIKCSIRYIRGQKFIAVVPYKHYCFLIGRTYPGIIRFDLNTGEQIVIDIFAKELDAINIINNALFSDGYIMKENCIFLGLACNNNLFKFNLDTFEYSLIPIDCSFKGIGGISSNGDTIWLTDFGKNGSELVGYDILNNSTETVHMPIRDRLLAPVISGEKLYLFPMTDKHKMISYGLNTRQWELHEDFNEDADEKSGRIIAVAAYGDSIVGVFEHSKKWFRFQNGVYDFFNYTVNSEELDIKLFKESRGSYISETDMGLEKFIMLLESE